MSFSSQLVSSEKINLSFEPSINLPCHKVLFLGDLCINCFTQCVERQGKMSDNETTGTHPHRYSLRSGSSQLHLVLPRGIMQRFHLHCLMDQATMTEHGGKSVSAEATDQELHRLTRLWQEPPVGPVEWCGSGRLRLRIDQRYLGWPGSTALPQTLARLRSALVSQRANRGLNK